MGWLFGWNSRKELVDHLCQGNGVETLKRCFKGNDMWTVQRTPGGVVFACLYRMAGRAGSRDGWGYKDVDETMGPSRTDFPVAWLDLLSPIESPYAIEWRQRVRDRGERTSRLRVGTFWKFPSGGVWKIVKRRSPTSFIVENKHEGRYRASLAHFARAEQVEGFPRPETSLQLELAFTE